MRNCQGGPQKVARNSIEQSFNKVRKRCNSNDLNSMFEIVAGELRAKLGAVSAMPQVRSGHDTCAAARPGRASRRRAQPPISHHAPLLWRAPEGPEGTGGLRDRPLRAAGSRVAISRAAGPDGARNTSGTTSTQQPRNANTRQPHRSEGPGRVLVGGVRAWPGFETTRPATDQPPCATVVEGAGGSGGRGRASRSTTPSEARVWRSRGRPGPPAPATPASPQANTHRKAAAHRHTQRFGPQNKTRGSPSGPPRVHATSSYSTPSRGRAFSAVAGPRPRRPGPR